MGFDSWSYSQVREHSLRVLVLGVTHRPASVFSKVMNMYPRIRELREDKGLSQTELAKILQMSQTGYSKYETGENDIPTTILIALSNYYHTSVDYILGLTDVKRPYSRVS